MSDGKHGPLSGAVKKEAMLAAAHADADTMMMVANASGPDIVMALSQSQSASDQKTAQLNAAYAALAANPLAMGRVSTVAAQDPTFVANELAAIEEEERKLAFRKQLLQFVQQLQNLIKTVYFAGGVGPLQIVPVGRLADGTLRFVPAHSVTVEHIVKCAFLVICPVGVDPTTCLAAGPGENPAAGWKRIDDVRVELAADTARPHVPTALSFWSGGNFHLRYGGYSIERCQYLHRTVKMSIANAEGAAVKPE